MYGQMCIEKRYVWTDVYRKRYVWTDVYRKVVYICIVTKEFTSMNHTPE